MKEALTIADAVVATLNGAPDGTFSEAFTAERNVLPRKKVAEITGLQVTVVPRSAETERATRSNSSWDFAIDVAVQKRLGRDFDAATELPAAAQVVTEIADYLYGRAMGSARYVQMANDPIYAPEHLSEFRTFTSVLTVTYRMMKG